MPASGHERRLGVSRTTSDLPPKVDQYGARPDFAFESRGGIGIDRLASRVASQ